MKNTVFMAVLLCLILCLAGCGTERENEHAEASENQNTTEWFTEDTKISEVISDPAFGSYGRLIFPVDSWYYSGDTLGDLQLTWYNNIDPAKTVEIVNYLKEHAEAGDTVFYDIYTEEEKAADPEKEDTGLFFFKGEPGEKFAVCNAGGGFAYVGAMQDSFPHALELSKRGYNAFACVGESDGIASWRTMQRRLETLESMGIPTEFHHYPGLRHGFGIGTGTVAEGWLDQAVEFWEAQM